MREPFAIDPTQREEQATIGLVKSQNSKVIVVGNAKNGLPLMYAGEK